MVRGFVTETEFDLVEREFPGIRQFYGTLASKPLTFLELMWLFLGARARPRAALEAGAPRAGRPGRPPERA